MCVCVLIYCPFHDSLSLNIHIVTDNVDHIQLKTINTCVKSIFLVLLDVHFTLFILLCKLFCY